MGLETATTISQLDKTYPLSEDDTNRGDDHLRLLKSVLLAQFPGALGAGFATAILASEAELNYLQGLSSNAQDQLTALGLRLDALEDSLIAPSGTAMLFYNTDVDVPTNWTIQTVVNNTMLRVVSTAAATSFTTGDSPILMDKVPTHTHTGTVDSDGAHTHNTTYYKSVNCDLGGSLPGRNCNATDDELTLASASNGAHTHAFTSDANGSAVNWTPSYSDVVIAVRD